MSNKAGLDYFKYIGWTIKYENTGYNRFLLRCELRVLVIQFQQLNRHTCGDNRMIVTDQRLSQCPA